MSIPIIVGFRCRSAKRRPGGSGVVGSSLARIGNALLLLALLGSTAVADPDSRTQGGQFLVAARDLLDPNFRHTVFLLVEHNSVGSLGVIINRRTELALSEAVAALAPFADQGHRLYRGGPVAPTALNFITAAAPPGPAMEVIEGVFLGGTRSGLKTLLEAGVAVDELRVYGGYAGWAPGQLDGELAAGSWHRTQGAARQVFLAEPDGLWQTLIEQLDPQGLLTRATAAEP